MIIIVNFRFKYGNRKALEEFVLQLNFLLAVINQISSFPCQSIFSPLCLGSLRITL